MSSNSGGLPPSTWAGGETWILGDHTEVEPDGWRRDPLLFQIDLKEHAIDGFFLGALTLPVPFAQHRVFTGLRVEWASADVQSIGVLHLKNALKLAFRAYGLPAQVIALWMVPSSEPIYVIPAAFSLKAVDHPKFTLALEADAPVPVIDECVRITVLSVVRKES